MSESVPSVSSAEVGLASGILGTGVGYVLAPRRYNLEQLLTQTPDVFEKSILKNKIPAHEEAPKKAYQQIMEARQSYMDAVSKNTGEAKLIELTRATSLESAYKNIKRFIPKAKAESAIIVGALASALAMVINYIASSRD